MNYPANTQSRNLAILFRVAVLFLLIHNITNAQQTFASDYKPKQVMDVYIIAIENIPCWWSSSLIANPSLDTAIAEIQNKNPDLEIRTHRITRLAYGRDLQYTPYINTVTNTKNMNFTIPFVYFYPGLTNSSWDAIGIDHLYYNADNIKGRLNVDNKIRTGYTLCDMYNHAVRYPEEELLYNEAVNESILYKKTAPEISLSMLIEKMNSAPKSELRNIILINLHGELLPLPPIRNYSDAAKDLRNYPNVRVVTHPENIQYFEGSEVNLRVYGYVTNPDDWDTDASLPIITIYLRDIEITDLNNIQIDKIIGNTDIDYNRITDIAPGPSNYSISYPGDGTLITLYNTPLRHPKNPVSDKGIDIFGRLYGMEYVPCPIEDDFSKDLNSNGNIKNTARWIIKIDGLENNQYTVETRIGDDLTTGTLKNNPTNLSKTYIWIGQESPEIEKYQFIGDPRHCPYLDVKLNQNYNWFFVEIPKDSDYKYFDETTDGWGDDKIDIDIPRFYQIYRQGLLNTQAIWSAMTGSAFYYYGLGGEFGSNRTPLPLGLPFLKQPWNNIDNQDTYMVYVNEIFPDRNSANIYPEIPVLENQRIAAKRDNSWHAKYWLGELYPDTENVASTNTWQTTGNLETGFNKYYRASYDTFPIFSRKRKSVITAGKGCASFFNGTPANNLDKHFRYADTKSIPPILAENKYYTGILTESEKELFSIFNFPELTDVGVIRPFTLNYKSDKPIEWYKPAYKEQRTVISIPSIYYNSNYKFLGSGEDPDINPFYASGVVKMTKDADNCYLVASGISMNSNFWTNDIGKITLFKIIKTFLNGGLSENTLKNIIVQIPSVSFASIKNYDKYIKPKTPIIVQWSAQWKRWDGENYTTKYPSDYSPNSPLVYNLKYSKDGGKTWYNSKDNSISYIGKKDTENRTFPQSTNFYSWNVGNINSFPQGEYILLIECYRNDIDLHYSYDQRKIEIVR
ncbi:MAG: hypothetical protein A2551_04135 [Elusimicrobia bacterium RIFOXYD2_FULL_34_30]|nr:MAG: hypothetical protein A2551_04135 [Elusimicrobia bacterium RIFOXYD2_FULL_34_30]